MLALMQHCQRFIVVTARDWPVAEFPGQFSPTDGGFDVFELIKDPATPQGEFLPLQVSCYSVGGQHHREILISAMELLEDPVLR